MEAPSHQQLQAQLAVPGSALKDAFCAFVCRLGNGDAALTAKQADAEAQVQAQAHAATESGLFHVRAHLTLHGPHALYIFVY